jgi:Protein of unknown function (DUF2380)
MIFPSYLVTLWTLLFVSCGPTVAQSVAVFDFELIDTSLEGAIRGARPDEQERLARLSDQLRQILFANDWPQPIVNIRWLTWRKTSDFIDISGEVTALITVWLEVRILPGPPCSPMRTGGSRSLTNSAQFAGIPAGSNAGRGVLASGRPSRPRAFIVEPLVIWGV